MLQKVIIILPLEVGTTQVGFLSFVLFCVTPSFMLFEDFAEFASGNFTHFIYTPC